MRRKTVKTLQLVNLPTKIVRSYYNALKRIEIQNTMPGISISGKVFIKFGLNEKGKIKLQDFDDSQLTVKPLRKKKPVSGLIKNKLNSITLNPPTDKSGQPVWITNWSLKYNIRMSKEKIVLNIYF